MVFLSHHIKKVWRLVTLYLLIFSALLFSTYQTAEAQDINSRLRRMENEVQTLNRAVYRGERPPARENDFKTAVSDLPASTQAGMEVRLSQIETELRSLTGILEQQNFEIRRFQEHIEKTMADMAMRIADVEAHMNGTTPAPRSSDSASNGSNNYVPQAVERPPPRSFVPSHHMAPSGTPPPLNIPTKEQLGTLTGTKIPSQQGMRSINTQGDPTPAGVYEKAFTLLRDKKYEQAEQAFQDFLNRYPGHNLSSNAKYWLGETFYVRNNFERAARIFAEAYQQHPEGTKGPDNLLKLALSLAGMDKKDDACLTLTQLKREYASGSSPILTRADREMSRLECP